MQTPNESILVYKGKFTLAANGKEVSVDGELNFEWFPSLGVRFSGIINSDLKTLLELTFLESNYELAVDSLLMGSCYQTASSIEKEAFIEGKMFGQIVRGDRSIKVGKVNFAVANLRDLPAEIIKTDIGLHEEILFDNEEYIITLKKLPDFKNTYKPLQKKGGFLMLYTGEVKHKRESISLEDTNKLLRCFSTFLTLVNGSRCSPVFRAGIFEEETIWIDYTAYLIDQYKTVKSWVPASIIDLNKIWKAFSDLWKDKDHKDFLIDATHWYTEANRQSGFTDGAIIMAQTGLELVYNWLLVEQKKFIIGKDAESLSAANKIRLLLSVLTISNEVPASLPNLKDLVDNKTNELIDAPDAFVQIRNAIVHSQASKRKKMATINDIIKFEVLQLGLWYIELSLLYILKHKGKYSNRCNYNGTVYEADKNVPWTQEVL